MKPFKSVEIIRVDTTLRIDHNLLIGWEQPVVIRGYDLGRCLSCWTPEYLESKGANKVVKVHRSSQPKLDFRHKNFTYETITFPELVRHCSGRTSEVSSDELVQKVENSPGLKFVDTKKNPDLVPDPVVYWYLRSLGEDPRGKDVSDLAKHFPELYEDISIPPVFSPELFFSSVFRITSPRLQLWTHYDTCHNILIQIKGRKRVVFYPPSEALNLYLDGDKSQVLDIDNPDIDKYPKFLSIERYEVFLEEGDIVFIPALWFHNVTALEFSISVNVFWKNLSLDLYDKKDTYGNRDLIPAQLGFRTLDKAAMQLKNLPCSYEDFYLRRMIISLENRLNKLRVDETPENDNQN